MKQLTEAARAAKLIKEQLKKYDLPKLSVKSKNYSGGDSIRVSWVNGHNYKEIEAIANRFQYGHFDGMQDLYEYSNVNKDIPQAKFVFCDRDIDFNMAVKLAEIIKKEYGHNITVESKGLNYNNKYERWDAHVDGDKNADQYNVWWSAKILNLSTWFNEKNGELIPVHPDRQPSIHTRA